MSKGKKQQKQRRLREARVRSGRVSAGSDSRSASPGAATGASPDTRAGEGKKRELIPLRWLWRLEDVQKVAGTSEGKLDLDRLRRYRLFANWLESQRQRYHEDKLHPLKIAELEKIGIDWQAPVRPASWQEQIDQLMAHTQTDAGSIDYEKVRANDYLANWLERQRQRRLRGELPTELERELDRLGMEWERQVCLPKRWRNRLGRLRERALASGRIDVARLREDRPLAQWVERQRQRGLAGALSGLEKEALEQLGIDWETPLLPQAPGWPVRIAELKAKGLSAAGTIDLERVRADPRLSSWLEQQRQRHQAGRLPQALAAELDRLGMNWDRAARLPQRWLGRLAQLRRSALSPSGRIDLEKVRRNRHLATWLRRQRQRWQRGELSPTQVAELEDLGMDWEEPVSRPRAEWQAERWERRLERVRRFFEESGAQQREDVTDASVRKWLANQRTQFRRGALSTVRKEKLDAVVPFDWRAVERPAVTAPTIGWEERLRAYRDHCPEGKPPRRADLPKELRLWANQQRRAFKRGQLPEEKARRLEEIGFEWEPRDLGVKGYWWQRCEEVAALIQQRRPRGLDERSPEERRAIFWINRQRALWRKGRLRPAQEEALRAAGVSPDPAPVQKWKERYAALRAECEQRFEGKVPPLHRLPHPLAKWVAHQRQRFRKGKLPAWQVEKLEALDISWEPEPSALPQWLERYERLRQFHAAHGHAHVMAHMDRTLAQWVIDQRTRKRRGTLSAEEERLLRELDFEFEPRERPRPEWMAHFRDLEVFYREYGHSEVPRIYPPNQALAEWVASQKQRRRQGRLHSFHIELLDRLAFPWVKQARRKSRNWMDWYRELKAFYDEHGHTRVPRGEQKELAEWVAAQKYRRKKGILNAERIARLDKLDFPWETHPKKRRKKVLFKR